jgi:hypothetical protein
MVARGNIFIGRKGYRAAKHTNYISDFCNYSSIKICERYINYEELLGRTIYKS